MKNKIIIFIGSLIMAACGDESSVIGEQFFDESSFTVTYVDTISVAMSTIRYDSLPTSFEGRLLIGSQFDDRLGHIHSVPYFQIGIDEASSYALSSDNFEFDSLTLAIEFDGYSYYDSEVSLPFSVYRVDEDIELDDLFLYNTSSFKVEDEVYGTNVIKPGKIREQYVMETKLKPSFGQELFDRLRDEPAEFRLNSEVVDYLKGFVIVVDTLVDAGFYGLTANTSLNLYYHNSDFIPNEQSIFGFPISGNIYFNHFEHSRKGTSIDTLHTSGDILRSEDNGNEVYISSGIGLGLRVEVPYLENLTYVPEEFIISRAILRIKPVNQSFDQDHTPLVPQMTTYEIDNNNEIIQLLPEQSVLKLDTDYDKDTYYELDITSFIIDQIESRQFNEKALLIIPNDESYYSSTDRLIIGDMFHESNSELVLHIILNN